MDGMLKYSVKLLEDLGDGPFSPSEEANSTLFECWADDQDHAMEQAENAYPGCDIVSVKVIS